MFDINVRTERKPSDGFDNLNMLMRAGIYTGVAEAMTMLETDVKKNFTSASGLNIRSGKLRNSISTSVKRKGSKTLGTIGSDSIYSAIHELGGTISARVSDYLVFRGSGGWVKVKSVTIPPRPFIRPSIEKNAYTIIDILVENINRRIRYGR